MICSRKKMVQRQVLNVLLDAQKIWHPPKR